MVAPRSEFCSDPLPTHQEGIRIVDEDGHVRLLCHLPGPGRVGVGDLRGEVIGVHGAGRAAPGGPDHLLLRLVRQVVVQQVPGLVHPAGVPALELVQGAAKLPFHEEVHAPACDNDMHSQYPKYVHIPLPDTWSFYKTKHVFLLPYHTSKTHFNVSRNMYFYQNLFLKVCETCDFYQDVFLKVC